MTENNGWPDLARPGVPLNPEQNGWHWLADRYGNLSAWRWSDDAGGPGDFQWETDDDGDPERMARQFTYAGVCLTPAEVAARVAAAEEAGGRAMRETSADTARNWPSGIKTVAQQDLSAAIRDLPLPHGALAAAERAAEARGRVAGLREAAAKVRVHATAAKQCSDEGDVIHRIRAEYLAKAFALNAAADDIEAAILALAEKEGV